MAGDTQEIEWALLGRLKPAEIDDALALGRRRRFAKREVVWHEGDRADTVQLIRSGRIAVRVMTSFGEVATIAVVGAGDAAGLVAVHATDPYHSTEAIALEATETLAMRIDALTELRRRFQSIDEALVRFLADRTIDLSIQLADALYVPAEARVIRRLVALAKLYDRGETEILIPLTQEDLAGLAGVTRPTANRVLKKEEQRGSVRLSRGTITVLDRAILSRRAT
jgi:CRP/FNR family transcriptional regulator, cyclic AMP receptor protein